MDALWVKADIFFINRDLTKAKFNNAEPTFWTEIFEVGSVVFWDQWHILRDLKGLSEATDIFPVTQYIFLRQRAYF